MLKQQSIRLGKLRCPTGNKAEFGHDIPWKPKPPDATSVFFYNYQLKCQKTEFQQI